MFNRQFILKSRPVGRPETSNFEMIETPVALPGQNEVLVKTVYLSIDPYLRNRMNEEPFVDPPFQLGEVIGGLAVGEVLESKSDRFRRGDFVLGTWGWQTHATVPDRQLNRLNPGLAPISAALGVLGIAGLTAYFGMTEIGKPKPGETVVISGAAGSVGSLAGQIAKIYGARVVGIAGSEEKIRYLKEELGFDAAINYRTSRHLKADLEQAAPNGIDVYFDNVGGEISDQVMKLLNPEARIPICGQIALYNDKSDTGPRVGMILLQKRARMQGFSFTQFESRFPEAIEAMTRWLNEKKLKYKEHVIEGFQNAPAVFCGLFQGINIGKLLVKV